MKGAAVLRSGIWVCVPVGMEQPLVRAGGEEGAGRGCRWWRTDDLQGWRKKEAALPSLLHFFCDSRFLFSFSSAIVSFFRRCRCALDPDVVGQEMVRLRWVLLSVTFLRLRVGGVGEGVGASGLRTRPWGGREAFLHGGTWRGFLVLLLLLLPSRCCLATGGGGEVGGVLFKIRGQQTPARPPTCTPLLRVLG